MKRKYLLGLDIAKQKLRAALSSANGALLWEKDLPVSAAGCAALLAQLRERVARPEQLLIVVEATGVLHLNWSAALAKAGYAVVVINPLIARRLCSLENALRDNKSDPIDARGLCEIGRLHGEKLLAKYRFQCEAGRFALQRLQRVRQALRSNLTNLKKSYQSLLDLSFPELGELLEVDGVGIRQLLAQAPTPQAIARKRLCSLQGNWMLRPKAAALKALAAQSLADPALAEASTAALRLLLASLRRLEEQLRAVDKEIEALAEQNLDPQSRALLETIPGFGPTLALKTLAYLPTQLLHTGNRRTAAARLQAFMGNDPRLKESGQWKGQTKMSKRGVEPLRTALFQAAFNAARHDPELRGFYLRKRARGKCHQLALSHLMRILTRRLVAVLRSQQPYQPNPAARLKNAAQKTCNQS